MGNKRRDRRRANSLVGGRASATRVQSQPIRSRGRAATRRDSAFHTLFNRRAALHATKAELELMARIAAKEARAGNDPDRLVTINGELHQTFYKAAHNRYLLQSVTTVVDALGLLRHSTFVLPGSAELAHREHL